MDNTHSNENGSTSEWRKRELGALWKKEGKSQQFYSGMVKLNKGTDQEKEIRLVIFVNKHKSSDRAPDLIIYEEKSEPVASEKSHDEIPDSFLV
jgi:hypothetical protein